VVRVVALKDEVEVGEQDSTTYEEKSRQDKTGTPEEKVERAADEKREEKLPPTPKSTPAGAGPSTLALVKPTFMKPSTPTLIINPPQIETPAFKLVRTVKEVIKPFPTPSSLKTVHLKAEPLKIVKPSPPTMESRPRQPQCYTKKLLPEVPKIKIVRPNLTQVSAVEEKRIQIKTPKIEQLRLTPAMPRVSLLTTQDLLPKPVGKEPVIEEMRMIAGAGEKPPEIPEEEIFIPPILDKLSTATDSIDRPLCIILSKKINDSFVYSVAVICREIYRIVKGGKPTPRWISRELKDEIERRLRAEDTIFIVDDSKSGLLPDFSKIRYWTELSEKINMEVMLDRLREFFSQDFGFTIFHVNERWASTFANQLRKELGARVNIIEVASPNWEAHIKKLIAGACWGFVDGEGETFDDIFASCEKKFFEKLAEARGDVELAHLLEEDKNAGWEHEAMKSIVVWCLAGELGAIRKEDVIRMLKNKIIETEHPSDGEKRCDVYVTTVTTPSRFVEIETFYGRGHHPLIRLDKDTLSKYKGKRNVDIVLLTGITALLYARQLIRLANTYREECGLEVNFYLPNIRERKLVPLKEVFRMLKSVIGPPERVEELTEDDVKRLWEEFSQALREGGMDPEKYRELFYLLLNRSKSYEENLCKLLEEAKFIKEGSG
jgi:hypothetical protein